MKLKRHCMRTQALMETSRSWILISFMQYDGWPSWEKLFKIFCWWSIFWVVIFIDAPFSNYTGKNMNSHNKHTNWTERHKNAHLCRENGVLILKVLHFMNSFRSWPYSQRNGKHWKWKWNIFSCKSNIWLKGTSRGPEALWSPYSDSCYNSVFCFP